MIIHTIAGLLVAQYIFIAFCMGALYALEEDFGFWETFWNCFPIVGIFIMLYHGLKKY